MASPLELFRIEIPPGQVAQAPLSRRDASRLLATERGTGRRSHRRFTELPRLLAPGTLLVLNNTRVIPARLTGTTSTGRPVEALLVHESAPGRWHAMVRGARRLRPGMRLHLGAGALEAEAAQRDDEGRWVLRFEEPERFRERLEAHGEAPLPPYIRREPGGARGVDRRAYQTVYARVDGAVAAPTAGLHFTPAVFGALAARGVERAELTLHVGPGTFRPLQSEDPARHRMHAESFSIPAATCRRVLDARRAGRPVVAVGTTVVRALESWAAQGWPESLCGETDLFIWPPYDFRAVDGLVTNFHQPSSTLLLLVAAFHGIGPTVEAYREAVAQGYRFFSYGDCMAILPHLEPA